MADCLRLLPPTTAVTASAGFYWSHRSNCLDELTHSGLQELLAAESHAQGSQLFRDDLILGRCLPATDVSFAARYLFSEVSYIPLGHVGRSAQMG